MDVTQRRKELCREKQIKHNLSFLSEPYLIPQSFAKYENIFLSWEHIFVAQNSNAISTKSSVMIISVCVFKKSRIGSRIGSQIGFQFLTSSNHQLFRNIAYVGYSWHFVISCICVFDIWEYQFWCPWTLGFSKI